MASRCWGGKKEGIVNKWRQPVYKVWQLLTQLTIELQLQAVENDHVVSINHEDRATDLWKKNKESATEYDLI